MSSKHRAGNGVRQVFPNIGSHMPNKNRRIAQMSSRKIVGSFVGLMAAATILVTGCAGGPVVSLAQGNPSETVESFYDWYLAYEGNPLVDQAYKSSDLLSDGFVAEVEETIASFDRGGADPILCAQDRPGEVSVGAAAVSDNTATVPVTQIWNPGTDYEATTSIAVELERVDGQWLITGVQCR